MIGVPLGPLALLPFFTPDDPAPSLMRRKSVSRNLDCERLSAEVASQRYPGLIAPPSPRGDYLERTAMVCRERLAPPGLRSARDEAVLSELEATAADRVEAAVAVRPELRDATWMVEVHYPSVPVATKVAFATKNALMEQGLVVSDRTPVLGAGDVDVLLRMSPDEAWPAACRRYADTDSLGETDALLAVVYRDPRATTLHAGLCLDGRWTWLP